MFFPGWRDRVAGVDTSRAGRRRRGKYQPRLQIVTEILEPRRYLAGDLLVTTEVPGANVYNLMQYTQQGDLIASQTIPQSPTATEYQGVHGLTVGPSGDVHIVDGSSSPFLDTYSPGQQPAWSYQTAPGWAIGGNVSYGEAAAYRNYVFTSDQGTFGIVRFESSGGPPALFAHGTSSYQVTLGLDGNLYELVGEGFEPYPNPIIDVYNPDTLAFVRSFHLTTPFASDIRSIAVDRSGNIYAADWGGTVSKYDPNGTLLKTQAGYSENLMNIAIDTDGQIAVGGRNGGVYLTDESLNSLQSFQTNQWNAFVTFDHYLGAPWVQFHPLAITATEGETFTGAVATAIDVGGSDPASDFAATIDWGDGATTRGTVSGSASTFTVNGTHTYADEGNYPVSVSLFDDHPGTAAATATTTATVADNDTLTAGASVTAAATQDVMFSGALARFTDSTYADNVPADFKAMIDWGDGVTSVGTVTGAGGSFTVSGSHDYTKQGTMTATIVLSDKAPGTAAGTATATMNVADAPLHASGTTITATEATPIAGPLNDIVATFSDADPNGVAGDYSATIDWGDGTTSVGAIGPIPIVEPDIVPIGGRLPSAPSGGRFLVAGPHTYAEDGTYTITVTIVDHGHTFTAAPAGSPTATDLGGSTATASSTAIVTEPPLTVTPLAVSGFERSPLASITVATFKHGIGLEPASGFTATIDWGDGTVGPGIVTEVGTTYTVSSSHTYLDEGSFKVGVHVSDDAISAGAVATAAIKEELLPNGTAGTPNQRFIQEVYRDLLHRQVDPVGLDYWTKLLDQGESRWQVVTAIISTAMPGELGADLVTGMYQKYLGRSPDAADLAYWVGVVSSVGTIENTEADIIGSQEFFALAGGTNAGFIERLFQVSLGRKPALEDTAYYLASLLSRQPRQQVAGEILNSPEYYAREIAGYYQSPTDLDGAATTAAPFIDDLDFLDRAADPTGLAAFTAAREHGTSDQQIWATMMASDEFFAKIA